MMKDERLFFPKMKRSIWRGIIVLLACTNWHIPIILITYLESSCDLFLPSHLCLRFRDLFCLSCYHPLFSPAMISLDFTILNGVATRPTHRIFDPTRGSRARSAQQPNIPRSTIIYASLRVCNRLEPPVT